MQISRLNTNKIISPVPESFMEKKFKRWIRVRIIMEKYGVSRVVAEKIVDASSRVKWPIVY